MNQLVVGKYRHDIKFLKPLYIDVLQKVFIHPIVPMLLASPLFLIISLSVIPMQKIANAAITQEINDKVIEPVLPRMVPFLKNIPAPTVEPTVSNIMEKNVIFLFFIFY
jgi:hypothetical protein